jgi:putative oxidoreductase
MSGLRDLASLVGRVLLALIFVMSGFDKLTGPEKTMGYMAMGGIPHLLLYPGIAASIAAELGCGLLIVLGFKARWAALALFLWLIPVTIMFHVIPYRAAVSAGKSMEALVNMVMAMKNLSMMGGLLLIVSLGAGGYSIDGERAG